MKKAKHKEHGEMKDTSVTVRVTSTAAQGLMSQATNLGLSRSDLLEKIGRGEIKLNVSSVQQLGNSLTA